MTSLVSFDDEIVRLLIRLKRFSVALELTNPLLQHRDDLAFFRVFWAASDEVIELATYLKTHAHEATATLTHVEREHAGSIRGRLDASKTAIRQRLTGNSTLFVSREATRSFATSQNYLLVWVLREARRLAVEFLRHIPNGSPYEMRFNRAKMLLEEASRSTGVTSASAQINLNSRPSSQAVSLSLRSRTKIYQIAGRAFLKLTAIESGDDVATKSLLNSCLLGPLETWRKFELFTAVSAAESLSRVLNRPCHLSSSFAQDGCLAVVDRFAIFWQTTTPAYSAPLLEPSEQKTADILEKMGMRAGWDRPDLVVMDQRTGEVVAIIEVKHFESAFDDGKKAVRAAVSQLVRYSRGFRSADDLDGLMTNSLVVASRVKFASLRSHTWGVPSVVDVDAIRALGLDHWSRVLISYDPLSLMVV